MLLMEKSSPIFELRYHDRKLSKDMEKVVEENKSEGVSDKCLGVSLVVQAITNYCVKNKVVKIKQFTILIRLLEVGVCINHSIQNMEAVKRGLHALVGGKKQMNK